MSALPNSVLARMSQDQQIVYSAMMMNPKMIPNFHEKEIELSHSLGVRIKQLLEERIFTKMYLNSEGKVKLV